MGELRELYHDTRERILGLVDGVDAPGLEVIVPAAPEWSLEFVDLARADAGALAASPDEPMTVVRTTGSRRARTRHLGRSRH